MQVFPLLGQQSCLRGLLDACLCHGFSFEEKLSPLLLTPFVFWFPRGQAERGTALTLVQMSSPQPLSELENANLEIASAIASPAISPSQTFLSSALAKRQLSRC